MYRSITVLVPEDLADEASAVLIERGAEGVEVEDSTVRLMPNKTVPPVGQARLIGYFSPETVDIGLSEDLADLVGQPVELTQELLPDRDWNEVWKSHFAPIEISPRLWVCPSWRLGEAPTTARVLILDPGMAFGTGTHATTSLCLTAIDRYLESHRGASVLDVGTGSGILSIASKLLGAGSVVGTDVDDVAIRVAQENAALNKVDLALSTAGLDTLPQGFDLVVANIMAQTLIDLAPLLIARLGRTAELLLSGILDFQADDVAKAFVAQGLPEPERAVQGEWVLLHFRR
jgi:ribosomal protein L11 methyltransferase